MKGKANSPYYWTIVTHKDWSLHLAATEEGLCYIGSRNQSFEELETWARTRKLDAEWVRDDRRLRPYAVELTQYLQGERRSFTVPLDLRGTPFQLSVWHALQAIPYGRTKSYSEIAEEIRNPSAVRAVGAAIGANPVLITVPCHRVIGKDGALTGYRGGMEMKRRLLELERNV